MKKIFLTILFLSSFQIFSCQFIRVVTNNTERLLFRNPAKVPGKITEPIRPGVRLSALWVGHATVLLQMEDKVIMTDPFLTKTAGEFLMRIQEPGVDIENIPQLDMIIISHSHMDHLNYGSLEMLEEKFPGADLIFPADVEKFIPDFDFRMHRIDNNDGFFRNKGISSGKKYIGESRVINGIKVTSVYALHWGGRYLVDGFYWTDKGFSGFIIEYRGMTVYFAGDTGYNQEAFKEIGNNFDIDLALIPIGPCKECTALGYRNHVDPPEAMMIFEDVKADYMIPIHYGTLQFLSTAVKPLSAMRRIIIENPDYQRKVKMLKIGEQLVLDDNLFKK